MSRIHKEHLQAGYIFGDTINQEYIYLPSGEVGTDHPLAVLETPTKREDITLDEAVHMIDTLTLKRCSHPTLGKNHFNKYNFLNITKRVDLIYPLFTYAYIILRFYNWLLPHCTVKL